MFADRMECPLSKEELLELVEEEARLRVSAGFLQEVFSHKFSSRRFFSQKFSSKRFFLNIFPPGGFFSKIFLGEVFSQKLWLISLGLFQVELEEREGKTDGTAAIQRMQEELVSRHFLFISDSVKTIERR